MEFIGGTAFCLVARSLVIDSRPAGRLAEHMCGVFLPCIQEARVTLFTVIDLSDTDRSAGRVAVEGASGDTDFCVIGMAVILAIFPLWGDDDIFRLHLEFK